MKPIHEWTADIAEQTNKPPDGLCGMCEENKADPDAICKSCNLPICEDCLVHMTYKNQVDYTICKSCYGRDE